MKELSRFAQYIGFRSRSNKTVATSVIHKILCNPVYYGLIQWGDEEHQGQQTPLISRELFEIVQEIMHDRNQTKAKPDAEKVFL